MRKIFKIIVWTLLVCVLAAAGMAGAAIYYDRKVPNFTGRFDVYVYPGMDLTEVCDSVIASGKVKRPSSLQRALKFQGVESMKPGHYVLDGHSTSIYAARMFKMGWQTPVQLRLSGSIRTRSSLAAKIAAQMMVGREELEAAFSDANTLRHYGVDTVSFFTMVLPDSYEMYWTASVEEIMDRLKKEHDDYWDEERIGLARKQGLSELEVATLASIVDGETKYEPEMPRIAGVYLNRLRTGMKLQADPTVAFIFGYRLNRILKKHLAADSPYNTYRNFGLPPGPISCPPKACLEAVLHPEEHAYLYFCADPSFNGSHLFAKTYNEHLSNARAFQKALTARAKSK
ncbi:MAG: endolytic transglycosylase MltG [Bacteroidales bacterium]|nr:endolytic transglycosylase MltG [Bacteroidales bacterium]